MLPSDDTSLDPTPSPEIATVDVEPDAATAPAMIEARGLSKYYGPFVAVEDISFVIPQGQIVAFLGPNGAGKTTMMRMLTGYLAPSAGSAAIAGHDVRRDRIAASRHLGYLPENGPTYPDMTRSNCCASSARRASCRRIT